MTFLIQALETLGTCVNKRVRGIHFTHPISPIPANRPGMCPRRNVASVASLMGEVCGDGSRPERLPRSQSLATGPMARSAAELLGKAAGQVAGVDVDLLVENEMETCRSARSEGESMREKAREASRATR